MKKLNRLNVAIVMILILTVILQSSFGTRAATSKTPRLEVSQKFQSQGKDVNEDNVICEYKLTGVDGTEPLPNGSSGSYTFAIKGNGKFGMDILVPTDSGSGSTAIKYTKAGVYEYTLERTSASGISESELANYKLDNSKYTIRVYIVYDNTDLTFGCIEVVDKNGNKPDEICYIHGVPFDESTGDEITTESPSVSPPADSQKSGQSDPAKSATVKEKPLTGDEIALLAIVSILGLSVLGIIIILILKRRKDK